MTDESSGTMLVADDAPHYVEMVRTGNLERIGTADDTGHRLTTQE